MNAKRWIGLIILIIGVIGIIYSKHHMGRISTAKHDVDTFSGPFSGKPVGREIHGALKAKASGYDEEVMWLMISSIVFVVVGGGMLVFCKNKKQG